MPPHHPKARALAVPPQELEGDVVLFDTLTQRYFALNAVAATVWRGADGTRSPMQIADLVRDAHALPAADDATALALADLGASGLLETAPTERVDRRGALRRLAAAGVAMAALPAVASLVAPSPLAALSGVPDLDDEGRPRTGPGCYWVTNMAGKKGFGYGTTLQDAIDEAWSNARVIAVDLAADRGGTLVTFYAELEGNGLGEDGRYYAGVQIFNYCVR